MSRPDIIPGDPVPIDATITRHADGQETVIVADGREMLTEESRAPFGRSIRFAVRYLGPEERHTPLLLSMAAEAHPLPAPGETSAAFRARLSKAGYPTMEDADVVAPEMPSDERLRAMRDAAAELFDVVRDYLAWLGDQERPPVSALEARARAVIARIEERSRG